MKSLYVTLFLNELELIYLTQLNGFKYCNLILMILSNLNQLLVHSYKVLSIVCHYKSF